jgi:hypothetical protein
LARKILALVRSVAEGFVLRVATSAKADCRPSTETEFLPILIEEFKLSFDANWPIIENRHFGCCHGFPPDLNKLIAPRLPLTR